jgi:type III restriction enzyme
MASADVAAKREAAERWANHVSADSAVSATWRYLLASQADIRTVKGSWPALKRIASS